MLRHLTLDYRRETRLHDQLRITLWPRRVGNSSFTLGGSIHILAAEDERRAGQVAALATQVIACVGPDGGKVSVPDAWRQHFPTTDPGESPPPVDGAPSA